MFTNADEVLRFIKDEDVRFVDVRFCDLPGVMQHFNVPAQSLDEGFFSNGQMFDGSSIRGFQAIHESDMKLIPDVTTAYVDPFRKEKTLNINFSIRDPFTDEPYSRDPRNVAAKAEAYLASTGIADTVYFGPEAEFYVFDDVRFETKQLPRMMEQLKARYGAPVSEVKDPIGKEGQPVRVKVLEADEKGRLRLSMKAVAEGEKKSPPSGGLSSS